MKLVNPRRLVALYAAVLMLTLIIFAASLAWAASLIEPSQPLIDAEPAPRREYPVSVAVSPHLGNGALTALAMAESPTVELLETAAAAEALQQNRATIASVTTSYSALIDDIATRQQIIDAALNCGLTHDEAELLYRTETKYRLPAGLLLAVVMHESNCTIWAVNINDNGTWDGGFAQVNSSTWPWLADAVGIENPNPFLAEHNLEMAAWYLRYLLDRYGSVTAALTAYNRGEAGLERWREAHGTDASPYSDAVERRWEGIGV